MFNGNIPYPKDLFDIVSGLVFSGLDKQKIFLDLSQDSDLKNSLEIDDAQILSAIEDSFFVFKKE